MLGEEYGRTDRFRLRIDGSSFSGLFTPVEIGHIVMGSVGYGRSKSRGWMGSLLDEQRRQLGQGAKALAGLRQLVALARRVIAGVSLGQLGDCRVVRAT